MKFKPYEEYKKVDLPWIDKIPSHWEMKKIKYIFSERNERGKEREPLLVASQRHGVILKSMYENRTVEALRNLESLKYVNVGDFVISLRSFQGGIEYAYYSGIISPAYTIMIPKEKVVRRYFKYLAKSYNFIKLLQTCVTGIREGQNIDYNKLRDQKIFLPQKEEQDKIADFLDNNLGKIDKFVELTERQIDLLKEQKEVIINDAVTKGIDKNVEYKDSGIDWIGQIPRHWETFKNRHFLNENKNVVGSKSKEFNLLSLTKKGIIKRDLENPKGKFPSSFETYKIVKRNDIVFCLFDIDETPRTVGLSGLDGMITGAYNVFTINGINKFYLYYYYLAIDNKKALKSLYSGLRKTIRSNIFLGMEIPVPPINEQEIIVEYIYRETSKIDRTVELYKKEISLIKEYKTALIANAVTGKIDVRDYRLN